MDNGLAWFAMTPLELSRELYSVNPFPESIPLAAYLECHTRPGDKIAVMGSEPQIFSCRTGIRQPGSCIFIR
jgi:hypothetical protein